MITMKRINEYRHHRVQVKWNGNIHSHSAGSAAAAWHAAHIWNDGSVTSSYHHSSSLTADNWHAWHCKQQPAWYITYLL